MVSEMKCEEKFNKLYQEYIQNIFYINNLEQLDYHYILAVYCYQINNNIDRDQQSINIEYIQAITLSLLDLLKGLFADIPFKDNNQKRNLFVYETHQLREKMGQVLSKGLSGEEIYDSFNDRERIHIAMLKVLEFVSQHFRQLDLALINLYLNFMDLYYKINYIDHELLNQDKIRQMN